MNILVLGSNGYVGQMMTSSLRARGHSVIGTVRHLSNRDGVAVVSHRGELESMLEANPFDRIVHLPQLTAVDVDWLLEFIDGPRWVVFSSAQVVSRFPAPDTDVALAREAFAESRGAIVLRPTAIFGRGGDRNVSRVARAMARFRVPIVPGDGSSMVAPVHVDDLIDLVDSMPSCPPGVYGLAADEEVPLVELIVMIKEIVALRLPPVRLPRALLRSARRLGPLVGLRADQIERLLEDKVVEQALAKDVLRWAPQPLAIRIEEAVHQALAQRRDPHSRIPKASEPGLVGSPNP